MEARKNRQGGKINKRPSKVPVVVDLSSGSEKEEKSVPVAVAPAKKWKLERHPCVVAGCKLEVSTKSLLRKHVRDFHKLDPVELQLYAHKKPCVNRPTVSKKPAPFIGHSAKNSKSDSDDDDDYSTDSSSDQVKDEDKVEEAAICGLCCSSFFSSGGNEDFFGDSAFKEFVRKLIEKQAGFKKYYLGRLSRLRLCANCCRATKVAVKKSTANDKVEDKVLRLERKAQRGAKRLQKRMIEYSAEVRKLEEVINGGDGSCLEAHLEESPGEHNKLVMLLREGIVAAENNLQVYYGHVQSTICDDKVKVETSEESSSDEDEEKQEINRKAYVETRKDSPPKENTGLDVSKGSASDSGSDNYRPDSEQDDSADNFWSSGNSSEDYPRRRRSGRNRKGSKKKAVAVVDSRRKKRRITYKEVNSDDSSDADSSSESG